jgi:hypothetical protein
VPSTHGWSVVVVFVVVVSVVVVVVVVVVVIVVVVVSHANATLFRSMIAVLYSPILRTSPGVKEAVICFESSFAEALPITSPFSSTSTLPFVYIFP